MEKTMADASRAGISSVWLLGMLLLSRLRKDCKAVITHFGFGCHVILYWNDYRATGKQED